MPVSYTHLDVYKRQVKDMNCPSYIKNDIGKLIELAIAEA